jgi:hypothetical protein
MALQERGCGRSRFYIRLPGAGRARGPDEVLTRGVVRRRKTKTREDGICEVMASGFLRSRSCIIDGEAVACGDDVTSQAP